MWSIENHSVHHCVCSVVQGGDLVHWGNSCLQDRSCEIIQESRCAVVQESRYSSLGHLHQKKKNENMGSVCICDGWCAATRRWRPQDSKSSTPHGSSAALRGHQDSGMSLGWAVFDSTSAFSIVTESMPQGASGCRDLCWMSCPFCCRVLVEADGLWWQSMADSLALGCDTLLVLGFEKIMPSSSSLNPVVGSDEWVVSEKS